MGKHRYQKQINWDHEIIQVVIITILPLLLLTSSCLALWRDHES